MAYSELRAALESLPGRDKPGGGGRMVSCPVHGEDRDPSLSMDRGTDDVILLTCHAGCRTEDVVAALGFEMGDLYPSARNGGHGRIWPRARRHAAGGTRSFEARYPDGTVAGLHRRRDDGRGEKRIWWEPRGVEPGRLALFLSWEPGTGPVVVVEGERSTLAVRAAGLDAVGTYGTGTMPSAEALSVLRDRDVVLWPDNDIKGRTHMLSIAMALEGVAAGVRVVEPPDDAPGGWDAADADAEAIAALVAAAAAPPRGEAAATAVHDVGLLPPSSSGAFPEAPHPVAFEGLLGQCVSAVEDGTDASRVGVLGSLVALCGALVPGRAYFHRWQTSSVFVALVGESSVGRKGTAMWRAVDALGNALEVDKVFRHLLDGINSGEGLIAGMERRERDTEGRPTAAVIFEEEYASMLASRGREGSTLDMKMRLAFDGGPLSNRKASGIVTVEPPYWLSALIAITPVELRRRLEPGAAMTGSANRWLHLPVVRRDVDPTNDPPVLPRWITERIFEARRHAIDRQDGQVVEVDPAVTARLMEYSDFLGGSAVGLAGDLSRRLAVIAFRTSLVHALVDGDRAVGLEHLERALALTEYSRRGIPWVFGATLGDPYAELLYRHLQEVGVLSQNAITQKVVRDSLKRQAAVDELERLGLARVRTVIPQGGGRRTELHLVADRGPFVPFVPGFAKGDGGNRAEPARTPGSHARPTLADASTDVARTPTDERGPDDSPLHVDARATAVWAKPCSDYAAHQDLHANRPGGWVCLACHPEEGT